MKRKTSWIIAAILVICLLAFVLVLALAVTGCMAESIFKPMAEEKNEVTYTDDYGHKHLHFCKELKEVKFLRNRYTVQQVDATKYVIHNTEEC